jgi:hypothetical protein
VKGSAIPIATAVIVGPMVGADMKETAKEKARRFHPKMQSGCGAGPTPMHLDAMRLFGWCGG